VLRLLFVQLVLTLIVSAVLWAAMDLRAGYSALVAGAICIIANSYFSWRVLRIKGARQAKQFVLAFCFGEMMKLVIIGVLFVLAIIYLHIAIGSFLIGFGINLLVFWVAPFVVVRET